MPVPFIDLQRFEPDFLDRWAAKCAEITRKTMFVGGAEVTRLEETLAREAQVPAVVACANGTDALQLALRAVGVGAGDVVLLPDATFWATFEAVVNVAARPVCVDIDLSDCQLDFGLFQKAVEQYRPKAVMITHLYGWASARLAEFRAFCRAHNLPLVEDGAQAYGVTIDGAPIFKDALIATVSFYPAKVLGSCGDAGAVYCSSAEQAALVRQLGNHGRSTHYGHSIVGWNSRMGGFDAAWLNLCHEYIGARLESRRQAAAHYYETYKRLGVCHVAPPAGQVENGYLTVALIPPAKRDAVAASLKASGIGFAHVYPGAMAVQPGAKDHLVGRVGGANADMLSASVLNLPLFAYMRPAELEECSAALAKALEAAG
jgi:dTDP-4-amino-4,6-dideoxygalactose transaminase